MPSFAKGRHTDLERNSFALSLRKKRDVRQRCIFTSFIVFLSASIAPCFDTMGMVNAYRVSVSKIVMKWRYTTQLSWSIDPLVSKDISPDCSSVLLVCVVLVDVFLQRFPNRKG